MIEDTYADGEGKASSFFDELRPSEFAFMDRQRWRWRANTDVRLTPAAKVVLDNLVMHANCKYEECFPSQELICREICMSENSVRAALKLLKECGWITWRRATHKSKRTFFVYRMLWHANPEIQLGRTVRQADDTPSKIEGSDQGNPSTLEAQNPQELSPNIRREITNSSSLSSASPTKESASRGEPPSPSAEANPHPKHSSKWWDWQLWYVSGPAFKAKFYPTISKAAFGKRLGEVKRRQGNDIPRVDQALLDAIKAEPGGDAWEYVTGILRGRPEAGKRALDELDRGYRPRAPIDDCIM